MAAKICARVRCVIGCGVMVMFGRFCGGGSARLRGYDVFMRGGARGSVFQTGLPFRQESEGLKTPGY